MLEEGEGACEGMLLVLQLGLLFECCYIFLVAGATIPFYVQCQIEQVALVLQQHKQAEENPQGNVQSRGAHL